MTKIIRSLAVVIVLLLAGLSLALIGMLISFHSVHADPGVLYAAPTATGSGDCSDWVNACTLQEALAVSISGDQIWAQEGVHKPITSTDRTVSFVLKGGVAVYGGFDGAETQLDQRDWQLHVTVLSGDIDNNDITDPQGVVTSTANLVGNNNYHVVTSSGVTATAVLDGFTVTAGRADGSDLDGIGGGVYNSNSSPTLGNIRFSGNLAFYGGGMCNYMVSSPTLTNVVFSGNSAHNWGGGMYNGYGSSPSLMEVILSANSAGMEGGGMFNWESSPTLTNVSFSYNTAEFGGGMMNVTNSSPSLANVTFFNNTASNNGGGLYNDATSGSALSDVTLSGNTASNQGGGIYNGGALTLTTSTLSGSQAGWGGGIMNALSGSANLNASHIFSNTATVDGGGLYNRGVMIIENGSVVGGAGTGNAAIGGASAAGIFNYDGDLIIDDSEISYNHSANGAGGIFIHGGSLAMRNNTTIVHNTALILGGGLLVSARETTHITIIDSIFSANSAYDGGGVALNETTAVLTNTLFISNTATNRGGGLFSQNGSNPTLVDAAFSGNSALQGGGMHNYYSNPVLENVVFLSNSANAGGGGLANDYSHPMLMNVIFSANIAEYGGGMVNDFSSPALTNVAFSGNLAFEGGGMYNNNASGPTLTDFTFSANTADFGGGIANAHSTLTMTNGIFSDNLADEGGGMRNDSTSVTLINVTFANNSAASYGGGMYNQMESSARYCIFRSGKIKRT